MGGLNMWRRWLILTVLIVLLVFMSFGRVLRIYAPPWIFKKFPLEEVARRFEKDHPDVKVVLTRAEKWSAPLYITEWKNGKTPFDLFVGGSGSMLAPVIVGGWLEPLDDMLYGNMAPEKFVGGFLAAGRYKKPDGSGAYYPVIPFMGEVAIIGVNTKLMKKAGLWKDGRPVPIPSWDEEEFFSWFRKLKKVSPIGAHVQIWDREFMQYNWCGPILAMTGTFLEKDGKGFDVSSEAARKWLTFLQKMHKERIGIWTITDDAGYSKWKTGAVGSFYAAQGHIMELVSITKNESDIAYIGWPGAEKNGSIIWTHSVWIPKVSPNKDLAKMFIREQIFSRYFQQWSFNHYGKLPVIKDFYGEGITWFKDEMPTILAIANASKPIPLFKDLQKYLDILMKYLPEAAFGRMSVDEALKKIKEESKDLDFTDIRAM
ncbi:MAG: hypothetical protein DRP30_04405 [Thermotoga sp.]|nr:MAG: hypothetical protein DRP30_04405 [Thermotoga sp.]